MSVQPVYTRILLYVMLSSKSKSYIISLKIGRVSSIVLLIIIRYYYYYDHYYYYYYQMILLETLVELEQLDS